MSNFQGLVRKKRLDIHGKTLLFTLFKRAWGLAPWVTKEISTRSTWKS